MAQPYLTHAQRLALGAKARKRHPRQRHAAWSSRRRTEDPLELLAASMHGRLPELVALKYQLMAVSPFGYYRGAVPVMAADLATQPNTGILNQLCGDAHVRNLGAFEAPDGRLVFDINDFDETIRAPFEWDLKRMAASLVLAGRESGSKDRACGEAVDAFVSAYAELLACLAKMPVLDVVRFQVRRLGRTGTVAAVLAKAERATPLKTLDALTRPAIVGDQLLPGVEPCEDRRVFKEIPGASPSQPPTLRRVSQEEAAPVLASLAGYRETLLPERRHFLDQYRPIDVGFKIVGTGSVGLRDYVIYMEGNGAEDPLFLQVKEEAASGWLMYVEKLEGFRAEAEHDGRRTAEGQRAMQFQSDPFLGWTSIDGKPYLVRQLADHKASIQVDDLKGLGLVEYARICGELLARGHARSGDVVELHGYVGKGRTLAAALTNFAKKYADQTEKDWKALVRSGLGKLPVAAKPDKSDAAALPGGATKQ